MKTNLKTIRIEKGLTQGEAARRIGITQQRLSHYEVGIRQPGLEIIRKAAEIYGVTVDELIGEPLEEA